MKEKQTITADDVGTIPTGLVPVEIPADTAMMGFQDINSVRGSYLSFPMSRSKRWELLRAEFPDLREYEPVLVTQRSTGETAIRVGKGMSFRCWYIAGVHAWIHSAIDTGMVIAASKENPGNSSELVESVEAVIVVIHENFLLPCRASFRKALASCGIAMEQARVHPETGVTSKKWATEFPQTTKVPPQFRYTARIGPIVVAPSRRKPGFTYPTSRVKIEPSTPQECAALQVATKDKDYQETLRGCIAQYVERVNEIKSKLVAKAA